MSTILDQIVASKRKELVEAEAAVPFRALEQRLGAAEPVRDFRAALDRPGEVRFLCEIKKAASAALALLTDITSPIA